MKIAKEFKEFAVKGNVVDMAVGVVIGGAFGKIVSSFLNDILMPPLGLLMGGTDFTDQKITLKTAAGAVKEVSLNYGSFITAITDFAIVAAAVFLFIRIINSLKRSEPAASPPEKNCVECLGTIPLKAKRCAHCSQPQPTETMPCEILSIAMAAALVLSAGLAAAAESAPATKKWKDAAETSLVTTNGNTKTTTLAVKNLFTYLFTPATSLELEGGALRTQAQGLLTAEQFYAGEKVPVKFDDRNYAFEKYRWDRNRFTGLRHRHEASIGLGRDFWKTDKDLFLAEGGPAYVIEERIGEKRRSFGASRLFAKYGHDFSAAVKFLQTAEHTQSFKDRRDYRLNTETSFTSALSSIFSLKTSFLWKHVGQPPPHNVKDDTMTSLAVIANF